MAIQPHNRQYDLVLYGATGYTGKLTAEHVAQHLPTNLKWALAGRSQSKLEEVAASLRELNPDRVAPGIEIVEDASSALPPLAARTRVLITTVGPYLLHGEPALTACVEHGTHYLDISGETVFLARMLKKYAARAAETGAVAISQAGVESVPADVFTFALARFVREAFGNDAGLGHVSFSMGLDDGFSGGSVASMLELLGNVPMAELRDTHLPYALSPVKNERPARDKYPLPALLGVRDIPRLGLQTKSIFGATDAAIVWRSWGLMQMLSDENEDDPQPQQHYPYGPEFSFAETAPCESRVEGTATYLGMVAVGMLIAMSSWFRALARWVVFKPGEGRTREKMARASGMFRAIGEVVVDGGGDGDGGERKVFAQARYEGSAYQWTGAFVAQAAMVLLEGKPKLPGGLLTPACLGQPYIDRLSDVGFCIHVKAIPTE